MNKICWISNAPAPYKVAFMNTLGKSVELTCIFETDAEKDREKDWYSYCFESFHGIYLTKQNSHQVIREMADQCDCLINSDYSKPICMYATALFKKRNKPVILHADGGLAIPRGLIIDRAISFVMRQANYYLSSGTEVDKYFIYYGIPKEKIRHYRFACFDEKTLNDNQQLTRNKDQLKEQLKVQGKFLVLSVGQPIERKGYDVLAEAVEGLPEEIEILVIGGQPQEKVEQIVNNRKLKNITFLPFMNAKELAKYYAAADLFVLPTRYDIWGLVINEAMSFGLPIVSTKTCVAALEFNHKFGNAKIVNPGESEPLRKAILSFYESKDDLIQCAARSKVGISNYTYENMALDFVKVFEEIL